MSLAVVQIALLRRLAGGPVYARTLQAGGGLVLVPRLVELGLVERVKPAGGKAKNCVALTAAGAAVLERAK